MNLKRLIVSTTLAACLSAGAVSAQSIEDQIFAQLRAQGFVEFEVTRTWLGRLRIEAEGPGIEREIIVNPSTGEILRDYWETDGDTSGSGLVSPQAGSGASGQHSDDDDNDEPDRDGDDHDDEDDDHDDDDDDDDGGGGDDDDDD